MARAGGARLRHRARLRRVHPVSRRSRLHRALDGANPPVAGPLPRLARARGAAPPGGVRDRPGGRPRGPPPRRRPSASRRRPWTALAIGGTLGRDKAEMRGVVEMTASHLDADAPRHLLGIGEPDDLVEGIALGVDLFDCAVPTRLARHGMALAPLPEARFRFDVRRAELSRRPAAAGRGLPVRRLRCAQPRLRPLPLASRGADRRSAARPPQPHLPGAPGPRRPGGDQGGALRRLPAGGPRRGPALAGLGAHFEQRPDRRSLRVASRGSPGSTESGRGGSA